LINKYFKLYPPKVNKKYEKNKFLKFRLKSNSAAILENKERGQKPTDKDGKSNVLFCCCKISCPLVILFED